MFSNFLVALKIRWMSLGENPITQRHMTILIHTSQATISRILKISEHKKNMYKSKIHSPNWKHIQLLHIRCRKICEISYLLNKICIKKNFSDHTPLQNQTDKQKNKIVLILLFRSGSVRVDKRPDMSTLLYVVF